MEQAKDRYDRMDLTITRLWPLLEQSLPAEKGVDEMKNKAEVSTKEKGNKSGEAFGGRVAVSEEDAWTSKDSTEEREERDQDEMDENEDVIEEVEELWWYVDSFGEPL